MPSLGVLKILLPVFVKMAALMDCIFRNLYGKLYFHQYLALSNKRELDNTDAYCDIIVARICK